MITRAKEDYARKTPWFIQLSSMHKLDLMGGRDKLGELHYCSRGAVP